MDDDAMAVDPDVPKTPPSSHFGQTLTPYSSFRSVERRPLLPLPQNQLDALNETMNEYSLMSDWQSHAVDTENDASKLRGLFSRVLMDLIAGLMSTSLKSTTIAPPTPKQAGDLIRNLKVEEFEAWKHGFHKGVNSGDWSELAFHPILRKPPSVDNLPRWNDPGHIIYRRLTKAYGASFIGDTAVNFVNYLERLDDEERTNTKHIYAKAIPVVQSSGTGKSRMLTEAGRRIFTLPICLRNPGDPGYPPADLEVVNYFATLSKDNDLSSTAHGAIACFIAAAHTTMLEWLKRMQAENNFDGPQLHKHWHKVMEPDGARDHRDRFFAEVVDRAKSSKANVEIPYKSPVRAKTGDPEPPHRDLTAYAESLYKTIVQEATKKLMVFLKTIYPQALSVTYFDEAHELGLCFWILLRLLHNQESSIKLWYVFMGTKSSLSYYAPRPSNLLSLRLKQELVHLLPPYIALGFDQRMIAKNRAAVTVSMGDLRTIEHLAQYGRPLWSAQLPEAKPGEMVSFASLKLTNGVNFNSSDKEHVFAALSQLICLDPVLAGSEAVRLADRSVAHHMRLLTGFSANDEIFHTSSPSEPILVQGSIDILYNTLETNRLACVLDTLNKDLCSSGLVEKGALGELGARILLLIARHFAAPLKDCRRDLLEPVRLMDFLRTLFGSNLWVGHNHHKFDAGLNNAHVNFTHWIVTRDPMPEEPNSQMLANLWARGAALQCCFTQESIDFLIPIYIGSVTPDAAFDPSCLSVAAGQVKFKVAGDKKAEAAIRPIGIPRDLSQPLPCLAILMELGNESNYQENHSKIKSTAPKPVTDGEFEELVGTWIAAEERLRKQSKERKKKATTTISKLKRDVKETRLAMDSCNRYAISVRGASPDVYGILREAGIVTQFATLLKTTMPAPSNQDRTMQYMRPLERLGAASNHTAWMPEYVLSRNPIAPTCDSDSDT